MQAKVDERLQALPGESEMPGLLEDIARLALANGLVVESVTPLDALSRSFFHEQPVQVGVAGLITTWRCSWRAWVACRASPRCTMWCFGVTASGCALTCWPRLTGMRRAVGGLYSGSPLPTTRPRCVIHFTGLRCGSII